MSWEEALKLFDEAAEVAQIERKGKTMPYASANGHMFALLNKDGQLGIRLSKEEQHQFDQDHGAAPLVSHGAIMKDYVLIPQKLLAKKELLAAYLKKGLSHARSLPAK